MSRRLSFIITHTMVVLLLHSVVLIAKIKKGRRLQSAGYEPIDQDVYMEPASAAGTRRIHLSHARTGRRTHAYTSC